MKSAGGHDLRAVLPPAQQCLDGDRLETAEADLRLEVKHEVPALDRLAQRLLDAEPVRCGDQQLRVIDAKAIAAQFFGSEKRGVGGAEQRGRIAPVLGEGRGAAAHTDRELAAIDDDRPLKEAHQAARAPLDLVDRARERKHQRELIATQTRDEARFAAYLSQSLADAHQHPVAELVTEAVVDRLEVVEVEEQHRELSATGGGGRDHLVQPLEEVTAVRQVRERIVLGEMPKLHRPLLDACLELSLVAAHYAFGIVELARHLVERLRELVDLARAAAAHPGRQVAGREAARAGGQPPHRPRDRPGRDREHEQREQDGLEGRVGDRALRIVDRAARGFRGRGQLLPRWRLDLLADAHRQRIAGGEICDAFRLEFGFEGADPPPHRHGALEVLLEQPEPGDAWRHPQFLAEAGEHAAQMPFARGRDGTLRPGRSRERGDRILADVRDRLGDLGQGVARHQCIADRHALRAGAAHSRVELVESRVERPPR